MGSRTAGDRQMKDRRTEQNPHTQTTQTETQTSGEPTPRCGHSLGDPPDTPSGLGRQRTASGNGHRAFKLSIILTKLNFH